MCFSYRCVLLFVLSAVLSGCGSGGGSAPAPIPVGTTSAVTSSSPSTATTGTLLVKPSFVPAVAAAARSIEEQTVSYEVFVLDDEETDVEAGPITYQKGTDTLRVENIPVDNLRNTVVVEAQDKAGEIVGVSVQKTDIGPGEQVLDAEIHRSLSGKVTFDRVPATDKGLDYASITSVPIACARVHLVDDATGRILLSTVSTKDGVYRFDTQGRQGDVRVRVAAETLEPPMKVVDNTNGGALYSVDSDPVDVATQGVDLNAPVTYVAGKGYTVRSGAPFACLEACRTAAAGFLAVRSKIVFPPLLVNWSVNNAPVNGEKPRGEIGTSHYSAGNLYILGKENQDTDEFDWHIMVHEWGHYYEDKLSRSDSVGGSHGDGDRLDARVALGEGWGNALSAIILYPDSIYRDTSGPDQAKTGIRFDLEDNSDTIPGWSSERSVQAIIYDVFDPQTAAEKSFDQVNVSLGTIHDVMTGSEKTTAALTTIFSFVNGCQQALPGFAATVGPLLAKHALRPVADDFGSGETNDGGNPDNLPLYRSVTVNGDAVTVRVTRSDTKTNRAESNRYIRVLSAKDGPLELIVSSTAVVTVAEYQNGKDTGSITYKAGGPEDSFNMGEVKKSEAVILVVTGSTPKSTYDVKVRVAQ